jgi:predicted peptidase
MNNVTLLLGALVLPLLAVTAFAEKRVDVKTLLQPKIFKDSDGKELKYRLLKPDNYDAKKKYPLVVFLHGAGERGDDNTAQLVHGIGDFASEENRKKYPCFLIAPQCPKDEKWADIDWSAATHTLPKEPSASGRLVLDLITAMEKEYSIDPKRLYLTGLSMGGYGTWDLIARKPELFAAAVPVCGGADEMTAPKVAKLPIWVFHGAKDSAVKVERSRNMVKALEKAGGSPKYTEYPDVGHDSWVRAYKDPELMKWLFAQKRE